MCVRRKSSPAISQSHKVSPSLSHSLNSHSPPPTSLDQSQVSRAHPIFMSFSWDMFSVSLKSPPSPSGGVGSVWRFVKNSCCYRKKPPADVFAGISPAAGPVSTVRYPPRLVIHGGVLARPANAQVGRRRSTTCSVWYHHTVR